MTDVRLSESEYRLMDVIWEKEPISAMELTGICLEKYDWKKSTVYTMLKRMGDKGLLLFENKMVESLVEKEQVNKSEGENLLPWSASGPAEMPQRNLAMTRHMPCEEDFPPQIGRAHV